MATTIIVIAMVYAVLFLPDLVKIFTNASVKKAEAKARAEEARTERARVEFDHAKFERSNNSLT